MDELQVGSMVDPEEELASLKRRMKNNELR